MDIAISKAGSELDDLVRRAEAGEEVVLTRDGAPAVRLAPVVQKPATAEETLSREQRRAKLEEIVRQARAKLETAPRFTLKDIDDEMYDENGLPK
jgi:prevent-host-death family protein